MCISSEAGSYLRLIDFVYHSTLGLRVIKKEEEAPDIAPTCQGARPRSALSYRGTSLIRNSAPLAMVVLGGGAVSYERGTPVGFRVYTPHGCMVRGSAGV